MLRYMGMKHPKTDPPGVRVTTLRIAGMSCGACVRHVTRALDGMTGVVHAQVDLRTNEAIVEHLPGYVDAEALIAAVRDAGYEAGIARTVDDLDVMARRPEASSACGVVVAAESRRRLSSPAGPVSAPVQLADGRCRGDSGTDCDVA